MADQESNLREPFRHRSAKIWRSIKRRFNTEMLWGREAVSFSTHSGPWRVAVEVTGRGGFGNGTEIRTQIRDPHELQLTLYRSDFIIGLVKRFVGIQDIQVGDGLLDDRFEIRGNNVERVLSFMDNPRLRARLRSAKRISLDLGASQEDRFFERAKGVSEFTVRVDGLIYAQEDLEEAFELFSECVSQLCHDCVGYEDDLEIHTARLGSPELVRRADRLLYDGWAARLYAAEAVLAAAHLDAIPALEASLREGPPALRAGAARALGGLGDATAIPALIAQLSDTIRVDHRTVGAWAGEALAQLGASRIAADVFAALGGTPLSGWTTRVDPYREEVLTALLRALDSDAWRHSLRALAELQAREVLPDLRQMYRVASTRSAKGQVLGEVIKALEGQSALPRPAEAPPERYDTLPRSAKESEPDRTDLPKPAARDQE